MGKNPKGQKLYTTLSFRQIGKKNKKKKTVIKWDWYLSLQKMDEISEKNIFSNLQR